MTRDEWLESCAMRTSCLGGGMLLGLFMGVCAHLYQRWVPLVFSVGLLIAAWCFEARRKNEARAKLLGTLQARLVDQRAKRSFEAKLASLIAETRAPGWDGEGGEAITEAQWVVVRSMVQAARSEEPHLPEPHPSAGGDGSRHVRWAVGERVLDVEFLRGDQGDAMRWTFRLGNAATSGEASSLEDILGRLRAFARVGSAREMAAARWAKR